MKVFAGVVTYNRKELLRQNLCAVLAQTFPIEEILVVDNNSTDGTYEYIEDLINEHAIRYVKLSENLGGAGGFRHIQSEFMMSTCEVVWMMDDDGRPSVECLSELMCRVGDFPILGPLIECQYDGMSHSSYDLEGAEERLISRLETQELVTPVHPFNGTLIKREVIEAIGMVNADLFIWGDEQEYRLRWLSRGFAEASVTSARYYHPQPGLKLRRLGIFKVPELARNRIYLFYRNQGYIDVRYRSTFTSVSSILRWVMTIILLEKSKVRAFSGLVNGVLGRLNPPHIR